MSQRFSIQVRLFGRHRESAGSPTVRVELAAGSTVRDLRSALSAHPAIQPSLVGAAVAVNRAYVSESEPVSEGDEVALIPPVAGG